MYLDLSKRYFPLPREVSSAGLGEPVITPEKVHLPVHYEDDAQGGNPSVAWDFNLLSFDGYSPETGWIRIDTSGNRVDKDRHLRAGIGAHLILREEEECAEEGFKIQEGWEGSREVLQQRKKPCEEAPARNRACHSITVRPGGPRRAQKAGDVHALAYLEPEDFEE